MVKETVQSLKAENDKLKEKVDTVFGELKQLKESLKQQRPGSHDASNGDEAGKILKRTVPTWPVWRSLRTEWCKQIFFCVLQ